MAATFEAQKNRKAFTYTAIICICLLLLFILISWKVLPPVVPVPQDLIEINLGNNDEGFGEDQPLKKGSSPAVEENRTPAKQPAAAQASEEKVTPDDNAEENAAPVTKPTKTITKTKVEKAETPVPAPTPKPQKPKILMNGPVSKTPGNNATDDNYKMSQGNKPGANGDNGDVNGNKDSYGNTPGGKVGGPKVIRGNRKVIRYYNFTGELPKATIYAIIKVSAAGKGTFIGFEKGSTSRGSQYADDIRKRLGSMEFDKAGEESNVTVQFNYNVN